MLIDLNNAINLFLFRLKKNIIINVINIDYMKAMDLSLRQTISTDLNLSPEAFHKNDDSGRKTLSPIKNANKKKKLKNTNYLMEKKISQSLFLSKDNMTKISWNLIGKKVR